MTWHPYLAPAIAKAPFLIAQLVSSRDPQRPLYVDAKLDTGSPCSAVPACALHYCKQSGIPLVEGRGFSISGAFEQSLRIRETYWFHVALCPSPGVRAGLTDDELREHFEATPCLFTTAGASDRQGQLGLEMARVEREYSLIGHDVLSNWTVLLHGQTQKFKVINRHCKWFVFSLAPR